MNHKLLAADKIVENKNLKLKEIVTRLEELTLLAGGLMIKSAQEIPNIRLTIPLNSMRRLSLTRGGMKDEDTVDEAHFFLNSYLID